LRPEVLFTEASRLLATGEYGVLSTVGEDGQPYGMPLNYVYKNDVICFHCARVGPKIEIDHISGKARR
jgi:nitroimidazol reductase NimA-like FMN-containing flavoprotein (pyridoxamine 5'-phosphate oxidase superfamily)